MPLFDAAIGCFNGSFTNSRAEDSLETLPGSSDGLVGKD